MNHEHYDRRREFVRSILQLNHLEIGGIEDVEYDSNGPFPYNNFIYLVTLASPTTTALTIRSSQTAKAQPGTKPLPAGTSTVIVRLANSDPGTGLNNTNRVENEVAFTSLARQALADSKYSHVVPDIYAWAGTSSGQGFSIQQHMPGSMPDRAFDDLKLEDKVVLLSQMADIFALLQKLQLPSSLDKFGGLTFDEEGEIISGQMTLFKGEPSANYVDFIRNMFANKLAEADDNSVMRGWRANGVRERLENLFSQGLERRLKSYEFARKVLVHSDLTTNNLLFNAETLQITALLDFDFSFIGTVADEYFVYSFHNLPGGQLPSPHDGPSAIDLRKAMLTDFKSPIPEPRDPEISWDIAEAWNSELLRVGVEKPSTISEFEELADVQRLLSTMSPFVLENPIMRERKTKEQLNQVRERTEGLLIKFLDEHAIEK